MPRRVIRGRLRVEKNNGTVIQCATSAETFVRVIDEVVSAVGITKVLNCKRNRNTSRAERYLGFPLMSTNLTDYSGAMPKYRKALKLSEKGLYVNTCSNDQKKKELLQEIFDELGIDWSIYII